MLSAIKDAFDLRSLQGYQDEDVLDIASDIAPKLSIFSTNEKLYKLVKDEGKSESDMLDHALGKISVSD